MSLQPKARQSVAGAHYPTTESRPRASYALNDSRQSAAYTSRRGITRFRTVYFDCAPGDVVKAGLIEVVFHLPSGIVVKGITDWVAQMTAVA
jgi:hypothetical protein